MTNQTGAADEPQAGAGPGTTPDRGATGGDDSATGGSPRTDEQPTTGDEGAGSQGGRQGAAGDPGTETGTDTDAVSPFVGIPVSDYVRDGVAALLLLVSLALPWDVAHRASDKVEVVLLTILSLLTLALPYLARTGVLPASWTVHTTRRVRLLANAPYALLVAIYLVVDVVGGGDLGDGWGGLGPAAALGLAGAVLAAQPRQSELGPQDVDRAVTTRWMQALLVLSGVLVVAVLLTVVLTVTGVRPEGALFVLAVLVAAAFLLALVGLPTLGTWRRSEAARLTLVALGVMLAVAFVLGSGNNGLAAIESTHTGRFGLVLVPALAAVAASPAVRRAMNPAEAVTTWVRVAVNALDLVMVVAGYLAVSAVLTLADGARGVPVVLAVVVGVLAVVVALVARRSLVRDPATGRPLALGAAGVVALLGIVLLVVTSNRVVLGGGVEHVLLAFGLPLLVVGALTVPNEIRAYFAEHRPVPVATAGEAARAYVWQPPAPKPARPAPSAPAPTGYGPAPTGVPGGPEHAQPAAGTARWAPGGDSTEVLPVQTVEPERSGYAARPGLTAADGSTTAVLPAYDEGNPGTGPQPTTASPTQPGYAQPSAQPGYAQPGYAQPGYAQPGYAQPGQAQPGHAQSGYQQAGQGYAPQTGPVQQPAAPAQPAGFTAAQALDPSTPLEVLAQIVQDAPHLRPQVAANPSTYPALLEWLGNLGDPAVDAALRSRRG